MDNNLSDEIAEVRQTLLKQLSQSAEPEALLRSVELRALYARIPMLPQDQRAAFGKALNELKQEISSQISIKGPKQLEAVDVSAPFAPASNGHASKPTLMSAAEGSIHPLSEESGRILQIFTTMGFSVVESPEIDDDWHMFSSLNFPIGHPARDDYDTFLTEQTDAEGNPWIAPAHTSTMQNRVLSRFKENLETENGLAVVIPGRVFRNEDLDARHEHTFYQLEGVYVAERVTIGNLIATLKTFLESYYAKKLVVKTQPFYFPFTEPSLEFVIGCPFCDQVGCRVCSHSGWIELLGCGMIHPNVLKMAEIDPLRYQGFAWGMGIERLVMMKENIEDVRLFESGRLDFLRQFSPGGSR